MGFIIPGKAEIWGRTPGQNTQLQIAAATWQTETKNNSTFSQISFGLVSDYASDKNETDLQEMLKHQLHRQPTLKPHQTIITYSYTLYLLFTNPCTSSDK